MANFATDLILEPAKRWPDRTAARCEGHSISYGQLSQAMLAMGGLLRSRGIAPGDRVVVVLPDSFSFLVSFLGCVLSGGVAVLLNNRLLQKDYQECLAAVGPALVIAPPGHCALAAAQEAGVPTLLLEDAGLTARVQGFDPITPHPALDDDLCLMLVTSGTTGLPKVVPHRQADFFAVGKYVGDFIGLRSDDILLCSSKMSHAYGLFFAPLLTLQAGATLLLDPDKPTAERTLQLLVRERATVFGSVPALYCMMLLALKGEVRLGNLRYCLSAGEALPAAVHLAWRETTGLDVGQGYGSTEAMTIVIGSRPGESIPGTAGRIIPPYEAVVLDEHHRPVPPGTPGQLGLRGPSFMRGYLNRPADLNPFTSDGLLLSGDMAVEEDGVFTILGRLDDMFKVGGLLVSPARVESALLSHAAVAQCAVTGGMVGAMTLVRAHVVLADGWTWTPDLEQALRAHARQSLPDYMVPSDIIALPALPMTISGKVQRFKLSETTRADSN